MLSKGVTLLSFVAVAFGQAASYVPTLVTCPSSTLITRTGSPLLGTQKLGVEEETYLQNRRDNILPPLWQAYLTNGTTGETGYNLSTIVSQNNYPRLATAVSGGGYRASLYGAGTLSALDSRNATSLGGLLQLSDYLSGLSGGSWIVSSLMLNDLPDLFSLVLGLNGEQGWLLDLDLLAPDGVLGISDNHQYYDDLLEDVRMKAAAGFPVSLADLWGRALSAHFFNSTTRANFYEDTGHDEGLLWSSIKYTQNFQAGAAPFPIVVTTSRVSEAMQTNDTSDTNVIPLSNTQFEFTPYTFGSFDPTLQATVPIEYAGTHLDNGVPSNTSACVNGYQTASFVIASSAALFNAVQDVFTSQAFAALLQSLEGDIAGIEGSASSIPLVANWPNSWRNFVPSDTTTFESAGNDILQITDGGENGENVPLSPLLVKSRAVDIILAIDASADTNFSWPNGTSLILTSQRVGLNNFSSFPPIPATSSEFVDQGLNTRPVFFGCNTTSNGANMSALGTFPIVVYLPSAPPAIVTESTYLTNTSTFKLDYSTNDTVSFLDAAHLNGLKGYPQSGSLSDPDWPLCLKCAVVDRARKRANVARSAACTTCLDRYCWSASSVPDDTSQGSGSTSSSGSPSQAAAAPGRKLTFRQSVLGATLLGGALLVI